MFQEFRCVEVLIAGPPRRCEVNTIGKYTEVSDEPHPVSANEQGQSKRNDDTNDWPTPQSYQGFRVRVKYAVRQVPWEEVSVLERTATKPSTEDVSRLVSERHDAPRRHQEDNELENANRQSIEPSGATS